MAIGLLMNPRQPPIAGGDLATRSAQLGCAAPPDEYDRHDARQARGPHVATPSRVAHLKPRHRPAPFYGPRHAEPIRKALTIARLCFHTRHWSPTTTHNKRNFTARGLPLRKSEDNFTHHKAQTQTRRASCSLVRKTRTHTHRAHPRAASCQKPRFFNQHSPNA